jgi:hypothetical protein
MRRYSSTLVMAYSPGTKFAVAVRSTTALTPLHLAVSEDNGRTWPLTWEVETEVLR